jgi:SpoVK/Ycf46/Vps4 family AAA+-type ATPase
MTFDENLRIHLKASVPAIYVETTEWMRFKNILEQSCKDLNKKCKFWNILEGIEGKFKDFVELLAHLKKYKDKNTVFVLEFADRYFDEPDTHRMFAIMLRSMRGKNNQIIVVSPTLTLPSTLEKEFSILDFPLPDKDDIRKILNAVKKEHLNDDKVDSNDAILDAVRGLGTTEIWNAFSKVAVSSERITAEEIPQLMSEKEQIIRKSGYLEFIPTNKSTSSMGGLGNLTKWLEDRKIAFGSKAQAKKLDAPKGVLLLGIPGTGKSLCAKVVAKKWEMPLLRLDMGRIFGGLVGESESNMRNAIKTAESLEPCILWIDEIEKGLSGGASSGGERDGGTSVRVFGSLLTWMQEKEKEVFVFATANDVSKLPPELLRKGRFDEIFFVDLPDKKERKEIFNIHLKNKEQKYQPTNELLKDTEGFSGAEIEAIIKEGLFLAYREHQDDNKTASISAKNLIDAKDKMTPLSTTMNETITGLREWAEHRCRLASDATPPEINTNKQSPRLMQEIVNIFKK